MLAKVALHTKPDAVPKEQKYFLPAGISSAQLRKAVKPLDRAGRPRILKKKNKKTKMKKKTEDDWAAATQPLMRRH